jgi:hypothetical protein
MSSVPKLRTTDSADLSVSVLGLLHATNKRLNERQDARPMGFKKRPNVGKRNMATPNTKKVPELHHEKSILRELKACSKGPNFWEKHHIQHLAGDAWFFPGSGHGLFF